MYRTNGTPMEKMILPFCLQIMCCLLPSLMRINREFLMVELISRSLEVHVYDEENGNFYLHHDILLAAYPLCLAWMDCVPQLSDSTNGHRKFF